MHQRYGAAMTKSTDTGKSASTKAGGKKAKANGASNPVGKTDAAHQEGVHNNEAKFAQLVDHSYLSEEGFDVVAEEVWGGAMYLYAGDDCPAPPEPPGEPIYCGATIRTAAVDVSAVTIPSAYDVVDVWGVVTGSAWVTASDLEVRS